MSYTASYIVNSSSAQGTTDFQFTFPYIKEEHIEVYLNYSKLTQGSGSAQYQVITNVSPKLIRLNTGIASANLRVEVRRNSSLGSPLVDYADGSTLTANDLDTSALQSLYIDQELKDNQGKTVSVDEDTGLPSMGESSAGNLRLTKVADPTAAQDAATKNYVDTTAEPKSDKLTELATMAQNTADALADLTATEVQAIDGLTASTDELNILDGVTATKDEINILDGVTATKDELNILDGVTATKDEINILDGVTATKDELNILDGVTATKDELNILDGVTATKDEINILDGVTATKDELNILDGVTATKDEINILDGVTATKDEINKLDGVTASTAEINKLDGVTATTTELNKLDGVTASTDELNKTDGLLATPTELNTLDGITSNTSELNKLDGVTATTNELNIVAGKTFKDSTGTLNTTSDTEIPSSKVIAAHVASSQTAIGGFVTIADEVSFPNTQPANGVVVSINNAAGVVINSSGVSTSGKRLDNTTVTINGFPDSLDGETLAAGVGLIVVSTSTANTYSYHKILTSETDVKQLSDDINDFNSRYRIAGSAPGSNNDAGDLYFDTAANKMKVYNGTTNAWDDVASVGNFYINTISSSSSTGGGSATFNGSAYRFTLSNPPTMAQQLIVSVNGVIQKPNSGTSQPSEGFAISGNDIIFSAAPASGSDYFIVTQGSSVSIGTPSDNTVTNAKIVDGEITNAKISSSANIAGSKLNDDSIAEVKLDIHNTPASGKYLKYTSNGMEWSDGASEGTDVKSTGESGTTKFLRTDGDGTSSWQVPPSYTHPDHSGEVTSSADGAQTIASNVVDEDNLKVSNSPTNGQFLQAQSGNTGGLTWADVSSSPTITATVSGSIGAGKAVVINSSGEVKAPAQTFTAEDPVDDSSATTDVDTGLSSTTDNVIDHNPPSYDKVTGRAIIDYNWAGSTGRWTPVKINETDTADVSSVSNQIAQSGSSQHSFNVGENKFITFYRSSTTSVRVVTMSGTDSNISLSQGTAITLAGGGYRFDGSYANMGNGLGVLLNYNSSNADIDTCVIQVANNGTGTTLTSESGQTLDGLGEGNATDLINNCFKHSDGKVVAAWRRNDDGTRSWQFRAGTVSSGDTTVSWGSSSTINTTSTNRTKLVEAGTGGNKELIAMWYSSSQIRYKVGTLSGTTVSWGSEQSLLTTSNTSSLSDFFDCCWDNSSGRLGIIYSKNTGNSQRLYICSASLSSGTLTKNTNHEELVHGMSGGNYPIPENCYITEASKTKNVFITGRMKGTSGNYRHIFSTTATLGSIGTELTTLEYVGISSAAYTNGQTATIDVTGGTNTAVSGLTPGSKYYVQGDGSLSTSTADPLIKAGIAISATKLLIKE